MGENFLKNYEKEKNDIVKHVTRWCKSWPWWPQTRNCLQFFYCIPQVGIIFIAFSIRLIPFGSFLFFSRGHDFSLIWLHLIQTFHLAFRKKFSEIFKSTRAIQKNVFSCKSW